MYLAFTPNDLITSLMSGFLGYLSSAKRNRNETKRNEISENETKRNETKSTKTKRNETKSTK